MRRLSLNEPLINQVYFKNSLIIGNYVISYFSFLTYHLFIVHMSIYFSSFTVTNQIKR